MASNLLRNVKDFKASIFDLKEKMNKLLKMCDSTDFKQTEAFDILQDGLINLIDIKYLNSEVQKEIEHFKEQATKEKDKVEEKNLLYQNFLYQKENIISQINSCINYPTHEMNKIEFPDKGSVLDNYRRHGKNIDNNEDIKRMDYLQYELETRKNLQEKVEELSQQKEENIQSLKEKEHFFKELPTCLKNLEASTLKAQKFFNINITEKNSSMALCNKMPPSMFVLFNSLHCIDRESVDYDVAILGLEEKVSEFYSTYAMDNLNFHEILSSKQSKEEGEHSDDGEINVNDEMSIKSYQKNRRNLKKMKHMPKSYNKKIEVSTAINQMSLDENINDSLSLISLPKITKFPLYIQLTISKVHMPELITDTIFPMKINFYYLPIFNIITTDATMTGSSSKFSTNQILSNLFLPPLNLVSNIKNEIHSSIHFICPECGPTEQFYDYIQILANNVNYNVHYIHQICEIIKNAKKSSKKIKSQHNKFPMEDIYYDDPRKISIDNFARGLIQRIQYLPLLHVQVEYLIKNSQIFPEATKELNNEKRFQNWKEKVSIASACEISQIEYFNFLETRHHSSLTHLDDNYQLISAFELDEEGNLIKKISKIPFSRYSEEEVIYLNITLKRKNLICTCYIEIGYDYPVRNPKFILALKMEESGKAPSEQVPDCLKKLVEESNILNFEYDNYTDVVRDIEVEVNDFCSEICPNDKLQWLLSYQLRNVMMCLDIFSDTDNYKTSSIYSKPMKGTKKKRPFSYDEIKNIFQARR